ncbi:polysaccharide biosynthesis C-terminal domain-containing protein [uncultured Maribacter sp.]|uniref:lipopolysaccharide biosynthesis protein n=1 Tax=uncultured Maribacter sp. TaxID=431308 RepID=UPI002604FD2D|nr:polysaccharide biosynthesis C-terminal domain-containing protein [uncultured Maribacter sp.]
MGIVRKQAISNTIVTYLGFALGAINVLFLYTNFLTDAYFGLVQVILSASAVIMPLMAFGVPNTIIKFYSTFKEKEKKDSFLSLMLLLPLVLILPIGALSYIANDTIGTFLSQKNEIVKDYVWYIFVIGLAMAYFEVFYAWGKVHMKSFFGNFLKEIFCRLGVTILLGLIHFKVITVETFLVLLAAVYIMRMLIMKIYAYRLRMPSLKIEIPDDIGDIIIYSALIILGGSTAIVLLEVDKVMINQFIKIENVAYYSVAGFMASTIAVPSRAMHQITYPLTAELLNKKKYKELKKLYKKSSLTLFSISGLLFLLLLVNLKDLYSFLPETYTAGFVIVAWIGMAKVYDALLGNNNSILFNSDFYRAVLLLGVLLAILTILFNLWLIPKYGLNGAAIASFLAFFIYNSIKLGFVKRKFNMSPLSKETFFVLFILLLLGTLFYFIPFAIHPILAILLKSILIISIYLSILYKFKISEDINLLINQFLRNFK